MIMQINKSALHPSDEVPDFCVYLFLETIKSAQYFKK